MACCCEWWKLGVPPTWLVVCGTLLTQIGWGLYPVVLKKFASGVNPLIFSFYRDLGCFPLLFFCALVVERKLLFPGIKMILVFMSLGLFGMFGSQLLYIFGVYWAGPNAASSIQPIMPVWTTVLALVSCTERIPSPFYVHTWLKFLSIFMATGGAIEITLTATQNHTHNTSSLFTNNATSSGVSTNLQLLGYMCIFGNTFCSAIYILIQKRFIFDKQESTWKNYPIYVTAYSYFFGAMFMGIASIYYAGSRQYSKFIMEGTSLYALMYAIFIASAMCYLLITWSNIHLSVTVLAAFWPLQVLVAVIASWFILHDTLAPFQYIGAVMVIVGLFLLLSSNHMAERLEDGKSVPRVDCHMTTKLDAAETKPLLSPGSHYSININSSISKPPDVIIKS